MALQDLIQVFRYGPAELVMMDADLIKLMAGNDAVQTAPGRFYFR